ncbi:hypothetical protein T4E_12262 [Trichinella pseudospiralis]|uniref:Uncharacterized protein n=1 Tax=Trichinella pseudospiralis TaxID=6337 RepID=A0A0V0X0P5_TRIPS|nr:hypothetical protein T4E_12262 [Trichinella pseudospiralis]
MLPSFVQTEATKSGEGVGTCGADVHCVCVRGYGVNCEKVLTTLGAGEAINYNVVVRGVIYDACVNRFKVFAGVTFKGTGVRESYRHFLNRLPSLG